MRLTTVPVSLAQANAFVEQHHRHHPRAVGHRFSIGMAGDDGELHGVAVIGHPVARHRDDGATLEVTRLCTDGTKNACSALYGAAAKAAFAMGYERIGTYILASETGTSLRAAGWRFMAQRSPRKGWDSPATTGRWNRKPYVEGARQLWEATA